jgi:LacI family transcriptional regulator
LNHRDSAPRSATAVDVARLAGVSTSTVSHVVNGTRTVSPETRRRVEAAIEATAYRIDPVARAMRGSSTDSIGFVAGDIANPYSTAVVRGIESAARKVGLTLLVADSNEDPTLEREALHALTRRRVDGLVVALTTTGGEDILRELSALRTPVVLIDRAVNARIDQVRVENERSAALLVRHLIDLGHRRISMVAGAAEDRTAQERVRGWMSACEEAGLRHGQEMLVRGDSHADRAEAVIHDLMARRDRPTGLFVGNNEMTIGVLRGLRSLGIRVPDDLALVTFDDFEWADVFEPRLTAMAQPTEAIGATAVALLLRRIAKPHARPKTVLLEPTLVDRESCGHAADGTRRPQRIAM